MNSPRQIPIPHQRVVLPAAFFMMAATLVLYALPIEPRGGIATLAVLALAPSCALGVALASLSAVPRRMGGAWLLFAAAAGCALIGQVVRSAGGGLADAQLADLGAMLLLAGGAAWDRPWRPGRRWVEGLLQVLVMVAAVALAIVHWIPERLPQAVQFGWWMFWLALAAGAWRRATGSAEPSGPLLSGRRTAGWVPLVVMTVLAGVLADVMFGGAVPARTLIAALLAGLILAAYAWRLLSLTRARSAERLELAQSRALIEVSQALAESHDLDDTLELVTTWAMRLLDGRAAVLELVTPDGELLELRAARGLPREAVGLRFPIEGSFTGWVAKHGQPRNAPDASMEPLLHATAEPYVGKSSLAAVPLQARGRILGVLACIGRRRFTADDMELLSAFAGQATAAIETARLFREVHQLSVTDPLTGLANRRQFERDLAREFAAARRGRRLFAVMFDMNDFKEFNDRYGHVAGDEALRAFGAVLRAETRAMNMAARYGGDEFIALLADNTPEGTETFIERVMSRFPPPDADPRLARISFVAGYAEYAPDMAEPRELIVAADGALYRQKAARGARV